MVNILVVEDDIKLNQAVCSYLNEKGYNAMGCPNANDAYDTMYATKFSMIISDIMMPEIDGFEFAETVRDMDAEMPILFMTARDDIVSMEKGFHVGVDDYMVKPINLDELVLRVGALLRRAKVFNDRLITVGGLVLDSDAMSAMVGGEDINLTVKEFNILFKLLSHPNMAFSRQKLIEEFWSADSETSLRAVDLIITKIREKISGCDEFKIVTVHGLGYKAVIRL